MHPRFVELFSHLDEQRDVLRTSAHGIPQNQWGQRPGNDQWSVAEVLEHLSIVERRLGTMIGTKFTEAKSQGLGPERDTTPILSTLNVPGILDRTRKVVAAETVRPSGSLSATAAWSAVEESRNHFQSTILAGDGFALGEILHPHPVLGPINLYQWILFVGAHEGRHAAQIREIGTAINK